MNIARYERIMSAYSRIEGRMSDRQNDITRRRETRQDRIVRFCTAGWDRLLESAVMRANAVDEQARIECGMVEGAGSYKVSHSWDVYFTAADGDGGTYTEMETGGYQEWRFETLKGAETYATLLRARFASDPNYSVSVQEVYHD